MSRTTPDLHKEITGQEEPEPTGEDESTFSLDYELLDGMDIPTDVVIDHVVSDGKQIEQGFMVDGNGMVMRDSVAEELEMRDAGNNAEAVCGEPNKPYSAVITCGRMPSFLISDFH